MVNISRLQKGDTLKALISNDNYDIKIGDIVEVVETGFSRWDNRHYADCKTYNGHKFELMRDFRNFELIK